MNATEWTPEYCGLSHLGRFSTQKTWLTVENFGDSAKLLVWFPGCRFSPSEKWFGSVEDAKEAGEKIYQESLS